MTSFFLEFLPEFTPKTDSSSNLIPRDYKVKGLTPIVGHLDEERLLCPVRALKYYEKHINKFPIKSRHLFVSLMNNSNPLSKNGISYLLRETIKDAHKDFPPGYYHPEDIRAHSIRGIATSLNFMKNRSFSAVMEAATWKGNNIFVAHYLKEVQRTYKHCSSLGPIIVAGTST